MVEGTRESFRTIGTNEDVFEKAKLTADSGFHSAKSVEYVEASGVDAYIADREMRRRDPAFADRDRHKERHRKEVRQRSGYQKRKRFGREDFIYDDNKQTCICPAGHNLYRSGQNVEVGGYRVARFKAPKTACRNCALRSQCLRYPDRTEQRQVAFFKGRSPKAPVRAIDAMKHKIDSVLGRLIYGKRMGTVEPVFGNLHNKGMRRFTLRGRTKVSTQWKLFTMVHNIEKIAHCAA